MTQMNNMIQIYAQSGPHDRAFICGTVDELKQLRDSLDLMLLENRDEAYLDTFTSDGEGYTLKIMRLEEEQFDQLILPYSDELYWGQPKKHPCVLK
jgi:hypothetical protein